MASEPTQQISTNLPLVYIHRPPSFFFPFKPHLEPHFHLLDPLDSPPPPQLIQSVQVLLCVGYAPITSHTLTLFPSLQLIVGTSAGLDHVDLQACRRRGLTVTNASVAFASDAADYAVSLLIDVLRRISAGDRFVRGGLWRVKGDYPLSFKLGGRRIGIVGLGNIGSEVAKRLVAFGCIIAYTSRKKKPAFSHPYYMNVHELATNSDALILCCSLTEETHHIINKDVLKALGQEGVIINVGRGSLINEKELLQFLVEGKIGGAGLDVFENEPDVPKELFALQNVVLSPHRAILTHEAIEALLELVVSNIKAFFAHEPLQSVVQIE